MSAVCRRAPLMATAIAVAVLLLSARVTFAQLDVTPPAILHDLKDNSMSADEIRTEEDTLSMSFISLEAFSGTELQELQGFLGQTSDDPAEIRSAVAANRTFETEFRARHIDIARVVAVTKDDDGNVTVYYNAPE